MVTFLNNDDNIWLKHISADQDTMALLRQLPGGARLDLEIEGVRGEWIRTKDGKDGRPTYALRPIGKTADFWKSMKSRRGQYLEMRIINPRDSYLESVGTTLTEWNSPEDEKHFNDL